MTRAPAIAPLLAALLVTPVAHAAETRAGDLDAEVGVDLFRANTHQEGPGGGAPADLGSQELGMRVRVRARDFTRRLALHLDYQGREPVGGDLAGVPIRLAYRAEATYGLVADRLTLGVGRFVAPSVVFLPVDGVRLDFTGDSITASVFAGRRGVTTSRRNLAFDDLLPAAGATVGWTMPGVWIEGHASWADDELVLTKASDAVESVQKFGSGSGYLRALWRSGEVLTVGGQASFAQRASYVIGPAWKGIRVDVNATELWNGVAWADWRPQKTLRFTVEGHTQDIGAFREGVLSGPPADGTTTPTLVAGLQDPHFTDARLKAAWRGLDAGWIRGEARYRIRNDRVELRTGGSIDVDRLGVEGLAARAFVTKEAVTFDSPAGKPDLDRLLWSAALTYRIEGLECEGGASYIERAAGPISSRIFVTGSPGTPSSPVDLSPFVLDAQRFAFVRAFYFSRHWFAGLDVQQNLEDSAERRVFLQIGAITEESW